PMRRTLVKRTPMRRTLVKRCGGHAETPAESPATASAASEARTDLVAVRRRGAGTDLAPNA
ncbi:hypothetical protein ABT281_05850, partial [Streptomyces filamentosus]